MNLNMKPISNYEDFYSITKDGKVWSNRNQRFLKARKRDGTYYIELNVKGEAHQYQISKLVYASWNNISLNSLNDYKILYKDNNKENNSIDNLEIYQYKNFSVNKDIKIIPEYPDYGATYDGEIWSYKTGKFLSQKIGKWDMHSVNLCINGKNKTELVHRLVLCAWNPIENYKKLQVNHKDENRNNNCVDNLEWCDSSYNINYGTRNIKVSSSLKKKVRCVETGEIFDSQHDVALFLGHKSDSNISNCLNGKQKTCGGYHWERVIIDE